MPRMRLTTTGDLIGITERQPDTRRRHHDPGRAFRSTSRYQRLRAQVFAEEDRCRLCGSTAEPNLDHIIPVKHGGPKYDRSNAQRLCGPCNRRKGAR